MIRLRIDPGFERALRRLAPSIRKRAKDALVKFIEDHTRPGLNFERLSGWSDCYTIRINRNFRILLRREEDGDDDEGPLYAAVDAGPHDLIYRRRK